MKVREAGIIYIDAVHGGVVVEGSHTAVEHQVRIHWPAQDVVQDEGLEGSAEVLHRQDIPNISISIV